MEGGSASEGLRELGARLRAATGSDRELDGAVAKLLDPDRATAPPDYTASVDRCVELVQRVLPGWSWHVGWDATGVLPYARLRRAERLVAASAPTVPLALLRAAVEAWDRAP